LRNISTFFLHLVIMCFILIVSIKTSGLKIIFHKKFDICMHFVFYQLCILYFINQTQLLVDNYAHTKKTYFCRFELKAGIWYFEINKLPSTFFSLLYVYIIVLAEPIIPS
jgi:hypothetical protein